MRLFGEKMGSQVLLPSVLKFVGNSYLFRMQHYEIIRMKKNMDILNDGDNM